MKNDFQKQKQIENGSVNLDFYEAWKVAEEEEQNKKKKRKNTKRGNQLRTLRTDPDPAQGDEVL